MKKLISSLLVIVLFPMQSVSFAGEQCQTFQGTAQLINAKSGSVLASFGNGFVLVCMNGNQRNGFAFANEKGEIQFATKIAGAGRIAIVKKEVYPAVEDDYFIQDGGLCITLDNRETAYCAYPHP